MSHPVGTHISKSQLHELNHWLQKHKFAQSRSNRTLLCELIDDTKTALSMKSAEHLTHDELDNYFETIDFLWDFEK